jgi:hypothetical protein
MKKECLTVSILQKELFHMLYSLPENSLLSLKPLLNELLTGAVLLNDPQANISEMDEWDKSLFLQTLRKLEHDEFVPFETALVECGVTLDEL